MKIGILTLWLGVDNYGQQLQIYALQKYLRNNGHDAYLIRYAYQTDILYTSEKNKLSKKVLRLLKIFNPIKLKTYIANKILLSKVSRINKENSRGFEEFRKKYVHVSEEYYKTYDGKMLVTICMRYQHLLLHMVKTKKMFPIKPFFHLNSFPLTCVLPSKK